MFLDQPDKSSTQRNKQKQQHKERPSVVVLDEGQVGVSHVPSLSSITAKIAMANISFSLAPSPRRYGNASTTLSAGAGAERTRRDLFNYCVHMILSGLRTLDTLEGPDYLHGWLSIRRGLVPQPHSALDLRLITKKTARDFQSASPSSRSVNEARSA